MIIIVNLSSLGDQLKVDGNTEKKYHMIATTKKDGMYVESYRDFEHSYMTVYYLYRHRLHSTKWEYSNSFWWVLFRRVFLPMMYNLNSLKDNNNKKSYLLI